MPPDLPGWHSRQGQGPELLNKACLAVFGGDQRHHDMAASAPVPIAGQHQLRISTVIVFYTIPVDVARMKGNSRFLTELSECRL
jgi:hypothetical protein